MSVNRSLPPRFFELETSPHSQVQQCMKQTSRLIMGYWIERSTKKQEVYKARYHCSRWRRKLSPRFFEFENWLQPNCKKEGPPASRSLQCQFWSLNTAMHKLSMADGQRRSWEFAKAKGQIPPSWSGKRHHHSKIRSMTDVTISINNSRTTHISTVQVKHDELWELWVEDTRYSNHTLQQYRHVSMIL